jgi:spore maturation protein CgeB
MSSPNPRQARMEANLGALATVQRPVAERLCGPVVDDHLTLSPSGGAMLEHRTRTLSLALDDATRASLLEELEEGVEVFLFGAGEPQLLLDALRAGHKVTLWDRDLALIRHLFYEVEIHKALSTKRLRVLMGVDCLEVLERRDQYQIVAHPLLFALYASEALLWELGVPSKLVCMCTGGLFIEDVAEALRDLGFGVLPLELIRVGKAEIDHTVSRAHPALILAINYVKGIEALGSRHRIPVACWEIDPTTDRILPSAGTTKWLHLFTYREAQVTAFAAAGFQRVTYLPLAANVSRRKPRACTPDEQQRYAVNVAHVGSSMDTQARHFEASYLQAYKAWRGGTAEAEAQGRQIMDEILASQRAEPCRYHVDAMMTERLGDFMAAMAERRPELDITNWLAEMAARDKRLEMMARLASFDPHVWGDPGWKSLEDRGVSYRGRAAHGDELTKIYSAARVQIDIGRIYQSDIVTMRVFDVLACGGFLLAEHSEALESCFDIGVELESWRSPEELESKVAYYLENSSEREAIAQRGLSAVRDRHRMRQRVKQIVGAARG